MSAPMTTAESTQRTRALIVDDEPVSRRWMAMCLARDGFAVDEAVDAGAALSSLRRQHYDVVLLDLDLGLGANGLEVLDTLRRRPGGEPTSVIIVSARGNEESTIALALAHGADDCLVKPLRPVELNARIAAAHRRALERHSLEGQLRQTQKLESIGRLAGGVAHDFNNLLAVIASATDLLHAEPGMSASALSIVGEIVTAATHGAALTRQLLAFSRRELIAPRAVDLGDVVEETRKLLARLVGEDVRMTTRRGEGATALVDPGQLGQVLFNLAVNARDAMPAGGELRVETGVVTVERTEAPYPGAEPGRYAFVRVADTGTGMTADVRARIFEPFFTTKARHQGTGLGLSVVYGVVRQAGGHIDVASELGRGTTFTVLLPLHDARAEAPTMTEAPARPPAPSTETVLVVEDHDALRRVATRVLRRAGYEVITADDGEDALRVLATHARPPHLVITDVVMPNLDGPGLAQEIHARWPDVKVLFTTGYAGDALAHLRLREDQVLQKPYTQTTLLDGVRGALAA